MISLVRPTFIRQKLLKKIYSLERKEEGSKYSSISEMKTEFFAFLSSMTFKNYLQQPKQMIEWLFIKNKKSQPKLLNVDININHPLIIEIRRRIFWRLEEDDDEYYHLFLSIYSNTITFIFPIERMNPGCCQFVYQVFVVVN